LARKVVILPRDEGADSHAIGTNVSLMSEVVFDWLDEVLDTGTQPISVCAPRVEAPARAANLVR